MGKKRKKLNLNENNLENILLLLEVLLYGNSFNTENERHALEEFSVRGNKRIGNQLNKTNEWLNEVINRQNSLLMIKTIDLSYTGSDFFPHGFLFISEKILFIGNKFSTQSCNDIVKHFAMFKSSHLIKTLSLSGTGFIKVTEVKKRRF